ncbi:MAG: hypothetical protein ACI9K2_001903 [Myxococcota bacterium]|jgi:hypothetical protein
MGPMLLVLLACQAPFGADRQDLVGFRVAGLVVPAVGAGDTTVPQVAIVVDGRPWSDEPVHLIWHWVEPTDAAVSGLIADDSPDAEGPEPTLVRPKRDSRLAVVAVAQDGTEARAFADPATAAADWALGGLTTAALPWDVRRVSAEQLEHRKRTSTVPVDGVERSGFIRFEAEITGQGSDAPTVRWMSTAGTWLELDQSTADWTPGELRLDGDDIEDRAVGEDGAVTVIALAVDGLGTVAFGAHDLWVGASPSGVRVADRWLTGDLPSGRIAATLVADDTSPTGLALADPGPPVDAPGDPWGTATLPCGDAGPFDPSWLLRQLCTRADVLGARIVLDVP